MKQTYHGSCHCGRVQLRGGHRPRQGTGKCNCSICCKTRYWGALIKPARVPPAVRRGRRSPTTSSATMSGTICSASSAASAPSAAAISRCSAATSSRSISPPRRSRPDRARRSAGPLRRRPQRQLDEPAGGDAAPLSRSAAASPLRFARGRCLCYRRGCACGSEAPGAPLRRIDRVSDMPQTEPARELSGPDTFFSASLAERIPRSPARSPRSCAASSTRSS